MQKVFSGIQPTNVMHIGNYFGAIVNWTALQEKYECIYCVVDLHAMTMPYEPAELSKNTRNMLVDLLACGIDPEKSTVFIQSMVPEHTELTWVLNCVTSYGELSRMTQFKDKSDLLKSTTKDQFISAGLFNYPILQAADILLYRAHFVPVGKDQEQHLELSRNIAVRFNNQFGEFFPLPKPLFTRVAKLLSPADPSRKMSKSLGPKHYISLFEEPEEIRKKIKTAVTDTGADPGEMSPGVANLFEMLHACGKDETAGTLMKDHQEGNLKYKVLKDEVAEALVELTSGLRQRKAEIESHPEELEKIIYHMADKARALASDTMKEVRKITGLPAIRY